MCYPYHYILWGQLNHSLLLYMGVDEGGEVGH